MKKGIPETIREVTDLEELKMEVSDVKSSHGTGGDDFENSSGGDFTEE